MKNFSISDDGFTTIELIVVIVVVALLAAAMLPRLSLIQSVGDTGYRDTVSASLAFARKSAIAQRRYVHVALAANNLTFTVDYDVPENTNSGLGTHPLILPSRSSYCSAGSANMICAPSGISLVGPNTLDFTPLGQLSNGAAAVFTVTGQSSYVLTVEAETGYVH